MSMAKVNWYELKFNQILVSEENILDFSLSSVCEDAHHARLPVERMSRTFCIYQGFIVNQRLSNLNLKWIACNIYPKAYLRHITTRPFLSIENLTGYLLVLERMKSF